jgi:hypothetical protein
MNKLIVFFLILFLICSCNNKQNEKTFVLPNIKDTTKITDFYFSPECMQRSKNEVKTLQKIGENANLNSSYKKFNYFLESSNDLFERKNLSKYPFSGFQIFVDTMNELSIESGYSNYPFLTFWDTINNKKRFEDSLRQNIEWENWKRNKKYVKALPVYIINQTKKSIVISEQETELFLIQEALDKNGKWKPIEYMTFSDCGDSFSEYILRPNYYLMTKVYKYKGGFETLIRIKMASDTIITYSKPFRGSINLSQFNIPYKRLENPNFLVREK